MPFQVSNSFKRSVAFSSLLTTTMPKLLLRRGIVRTYARPGRPRDDDDGDSTLPRKRLCISDTVPEALREALSNTVRGEQQADIQNPSSFPVARSADVSSSSPAPESVAFCSSDPVEADESELSTPPSSPVDPFSPPRRLSHKPAFSVLKRNGSEQLHPVKKRPLAEIDVNARSVPASLKSKRRKSQTQIDLGGEVRKTCRICGMEYIPSVKEDTALHRDYCGMNAGGIELGKTFFKDETLRYVRFQTTSKLETEDLVMVDQTSSPALKSKIKSILAVVNTDLSAVETTKDALWPQSTRNEEEQTTAQKRKRNQLPVDTSKEHFKAFLAVEHEKCVGFCLVEKIKHAFPVVETGDKRAKIAGASTISSSSVSHASSAELALLGISRIWVSKASRGHGIAKALLEAAQNNFFFGIQIPKSLMAFSQPTESGRQLAVKWFGQRIGWHVYVGCL